MTMKLDMNKIFETLDGLFSYEIEKLGNRDGYIIKIWDGYGVRRANAHGIDLEEALSESFQQYNEKKEF